MSGDPLGVRLSRRWVSAYTRGLPDEAAQRRQLEIESDLWEHLQDPDTDDRAVLGRTLRGIHADVWWRYRTLLDSRGARQRSHAMQDTKWNWWRLLAAVFGVLPLALGLVTLDDAGGGALIAPAASNVGGGLVLGGLAWQRRRVVAGSRLVIAGAVVAGLSDPVVLVVAPLVLIGGLWSGNLVLSDEGTDVVRLEAMQRSITDRWYWWLVGAAGLLAVGFATLVVWDSTGLVPADCTETNPCWEDSAAWATWILSWLAAAVTGAVGVLLGVLRLVSRHHTRSA